MSYVLLEILAVYKKIRKSRCGINGIGRVLCFRHGIPDEALAGESVKGISVI
jgi:hypothetical protein